MMMIPCWMLDLFVLFSGPFVAGISGEFENGRRLQALTVCMPDISMLRLGCLSGVKFQGSGSRLAVEPKVERVPRQLCCVVFMAARSYKSLYALSTMNECIRSIPIASSTKCTPCGVENAKCSVWCDMLEHEGFILGTSCRPWRSSGLSEARHGSSP